MAVDIRVVVMVAGGVFSVCCSYSVTRIGSETTARGGPDGNNASNMGGCHDFPLNSRGVVMFMLVGALSVIGVYSVARIGSETTARGGPE